MSIIYEYYVMNIWVLRHEHTSTTPWSIRVLRHEHVSTTSWTHEYYVTSIRGTYYVINRYTSTIYHTYTNDYNVLNIRKVYDFWAIQPSVSLNSRSILAQVFPTELWGSVARGLNTSHRSDRGQLATDKRTERVPETSHANEGGARQWPYYGARQWPYYRKIITGRLYSVSGPDGNHRPMSLWKRTEFYIVWCRERRNILVCAFARLPTLARLGVRPDDDCAANSWPNVWETAGSIFVSGNNWISVCASISLFVLVSGCACAVVHVYPSDIEFTYSCVYYAVRGCRPRRSGDLNTVDTVLTHATLVLAWLGGWTL